MQLNDNSRRIGISPAGTRIQFNKTGILALELTDPHPFTRCGPAPVASSGTAAGHFVPGDSLVKVLSFGHGMVCMCLKMEFTTHKNDHLMPFY